MKYTNREVADNFELWGEYFDTNATMTREQFDALAVADREKMIEAVFGTDAHQIEVTA